MERLLSRYGSLILVLLCALVAGNSFGPSTHFYPKVGPSSTTEHAFISNNFHEVVISQQEEHQTNRGLATVIEYEKNDEDDRGELRVSDQSSPATLFERRSASLGSYFKSVQTSQIHPNRFVWNLHASRCVIYQVFRL